jgi:hypothetical protein
MFVGHRIFVRKTTIVITGTALDELLGVAHQYDVTQSKTRSIHDFGAQNKTTNMRRYHDAGDAAYTTIIIIFTLQHYFHIIIISIDSRKCGY